MTATEVTKVPFVIIRGGTFGNQTQAKTLIWRRQDDVGVSEKGSTGQKPQMAKRRGTGCCDWWLLHLNSRSSP